MVRLLLTCNTLQVGDELYLEKIPYGFLTLARYQIACYHTTYGYLATGTGLGTILYSMLQDFETWSKYQ